MDSSRWSSVSGRITTITTPSWPSAGGPAGGGLCGVPPQAGARCVWVWPERRPLARGFDRGEISRDPSRAWLPGLPGPYREAHHLGAARRGKRGGHPAHGKLRDVAWLERERVLL